MEIINHSPFEKDIIKKFRRGIWSQFIKGIKKYDMVQEGDRIAIAMSGGKDSLLMAKLFQELKRHHLVNFEIEFISMDPGFSVENLEVHFKNAKDLDVPLNIERSNIFKILEKMGNDNPCYMCARLRRGALYKMAQDKCCNKLALGHHFDDVIETTMMNMLYAGTFKTMLPKIKSKNFENLELIRPMYLIKEVDIIKLMKHNNIVTMDCGCEMQACKVSSKRREMKLLIKDLKKTFNGSDQNIFHAAENVNLDSIARWTRDGKEFSFYDDWEKE